MTDEIYVTDAHGFLKNVVVKIPAREVRLTRTDLKDFIHADLVPLLLCIDDTPRTAREIRRMMYTLRLEGGVFNEPDEAMMTKFLMHLADSGLVVRSKQGNRGYQYRRKSHADVTERGENAL